MDTKKIAIIITTGILILGAVILFMLLGGKNNRISQEQKGTPTPTKEIEFVVVRVLPSGFSPKEVTIKPGMIVRFTNPTDTKVVLKWEGDTQFTTGSVYMGKDLASSVFEKAGTYTFSDDKNHSEKVVVK